MNEAILSIAIPTFNRAEYLNRLLKNLSDQFNASYNFEILICDNASEDNTGQVVANHQNVGLPIKYIRNEVNLGPDKNIAQCYLRATGKYVLVLGDDDLFTDGALKKISAILRSGTYGLIYLNFYGFIKDYILEKPSINLFNKTYILNCGDIFKIMRSNISFTSSNIINKHYLSENDISDTTGTNLNQLPGVINAALNADRNIYVGEYLLAQQMHNSGGYNYLKVFGTNFVTLTNRYLTKYGHNSNDVSRYKNWIFQDLVITLYPQVLYNTKQMEGKDKALLKYYMLDDLLDHSYIHKIFNYPIITLFKGADSSFLLLTKIIRKILSYYYKIPFRSKALFL